MSDYAAFLDRKRLAAPAAGIEVPEEALHPTLFPFQRELVRWALGRGRAAIWADTGLGKTIQQVTWAEQIHRNTGVDVLILAPLAVARQTEREARKVDVTVTVCRNQSHVRPGVNVTNYEMLHHFDASRFGAVVLDESGILKNFMGATKRALLEAFRDTRYRLCCTATPAPNDHLELGNHSEFLGVMPSNEMISRWFINDTMQAGNYRLKGHAVTDFWRWIVSWAAALTRPSDLGYEDGGFRLPPLEVRRHFVDVAPAAGQTLFGDAALNATGMHRELRRTAVRRSEEVAALVAADPGTWLIWCHTNYEADALREALPEALDLRGSDRLEEKEGKLIAFSEGQAPLLITKPSIAGHGLNLQHCRRMAFVGLSFCYDEKTEVLTKRGWLRFNEVTLADEVATTNPQTLAFEWQFPSRVIWEPYDGPMVRFQGQRNFDLLVTPNHKMFVKRCETRYRTNTNGYELREAGEIALSYKRLAWRMLSAPVCFSGREVPYVSIPLAEGRRISSRTRHIHPIPTHAFMKLAGWYLSEGYCSALDSKSAGRMVICQTDKNADHRREIIELFDNLGLKTGFQTKDITFSSVHLATFLVKHFGRHAHNKRIPRWVKDLPGEYLVMLRDTMLKGDGCHNHGIARFYRTVSEQLADDFQEICLKTGVRASVKRRDYDYGIARYGARPLYDVSLAWENTEPWIHRQPELTHYSGMVGCVTVPNHTVIVRRNGIPVVSGNSFESYYQAIRRCWRYGQTEPVQAHVVLAETELPLLEAIQRKEADHETMKAAMVRAMRESFRGETGARALRWNDEAPQLRLPGWLREVTA